MKLKWTEALVRGALVAAATGAAHAAPLAAASPAQAAANAATTAAVPGDRRRGEQIANQGAGSVPACVSCHGPQGHGVADFPHLAGQGQQYLLEQLQAFAAGTRANATMQPIASALSEADRRAAAAYFASLQPVAITARPADPATLKPADRGAWLAERGDFARGIPPCASCHGPQGRGVGGQFPMIAGLSANYLTQQIDAWQQGKRPAGPQQLMGTIAGKLKADDTRAVSAYFAGLTASATPAAAASGASPAAPASAAQAASGVRP